MNLVENILFFQINVAPEIVYEIDKIDWHKYSQFKEQRDKLENFIKSISFDSTKDKNLTFNVKFIYNDKINQSTDKITARKCLEKMQSIIDEFTDKLENLVSYEPLTFEYIYNNLKALGAVVRCIKKYY